MDFDRQKLVEDFDLLYEELFKKAELAIVENSHELYLEDIDKIATYLKTMRPKSKSRDLKHHLLQYLDAVTESPKVDTSKIYSLINLYIEPIYQELLRHGFLAKWSWVIYLLVISPVELLIVNLFIQSSVYYFPALAFVFALFFWNEERKAERDNKLLRIYKPLFSRKR